VTHFHHTRQQPYQSDDKVEIGSLAGMVRHRGYHRPGAGGRVNRVVCMHGHAWGIQEAIVTMLRSVHDLDRPYTLGTRLGLDKWDEVDEVDEIDEIECGRR
jgi:hypothetical protein